MKKSLLALSLGASACGIPMNGRPPTEDERAEIAMYVEREPESRELVVAIVRALPEDAPWAAADGTSTTRDAVIEDIEKTGKDITTYFEDDRIFVYSGAETDDMEHAGKLYGYAVTPHNILDDYLMLNVDNREYWDEEVLAHECGHRLFGAHDPKFEKWLEEQGQVYTDLTFGEAVQMYMDYSYQETGLYIPPIVLRNKLERERGTADLPDRETFAAENAEWLLEKVTFLEAYGGNAEMLAEAISETSWYEREREVRQELLQERNRERLRGVQLR